MATEKTTIKHVIKITETKNAVVVVETEQQKLRKGDKIEAFVTVCLPAIDYVLDSDFQFGKRVTVCNEELSHTWGAKHESDDNAPFRHRYIQKIIGAELTHDDARRVGLEYGVKQVAGLVDALKARREALENAGD